MSESVVFETSLGDIQLELYWNHAPKLSKRGYYNGVIFHRIISDFMVQGGDPTGTGRGGTSIYGQKFEDELHPELRFTGAGILAMANSGPNTNGSQFFLTLGPTPYLDGKHTIFGSAKGRRQNTQIKSCLNVPNTISLMRKYIYSGCLRHPRGETQQKHYFR
ncbi:cyclophilin-like protein [Lentinula edodes]|uniref:Peptidyl-prolyl cis-trans isomerase n=1 Tax=Lentinula edodes TaxID=5353 RepID=A0A1Q3E6E8_LENED|nr:cyclophilin-like protein [Lentinula edodes]